MQRRAARHASRSPNAVSAHLALALPGAHARDACAASALIIPKPNTIGPDRLANAVAARHRFGAPAVVVDFGTAVTFDVVDRAGNYVGGIIAPGLAAMTDYLHEKTALLPRIRIREVKSPIGKSTEQAMLVGAVHGYRGLIRELIVELKRELKVAASAGGGDRRLRAAHRLQAAGDHGRGPAADVGGAAPGMAGATEASAPTRCRRLKPLNRQAA